MAQFGSFACGLSGKYFANLAIVSASVAWLWLI